MLRLRLKACDPRSIRMFMHFKTLERGIRVSCSLVPRPFEGKGKGLGTSSCACAKITLKSGNRILQ